MTAPTAPAPIRSISDLAIGDRVAINPLYGLPDIRVSGVLQVTSKARTKVIVQRVLADGSLAPERGQVPATALVRADGLTNADIAANIASAPTPADFEPGELVSMTGRGASEGICVVIKSTQNRVHIARLGGGNVWSCTVNGIVKVTVAEYLATAAA